MTVLDGSTLEDLFWDNGIDFMHFRRGSSSWIEAPILGSTIRLSETWLSEDGLWTLQSDSLEVFRSSGENSFIYLDTPEFISESELIQYLMELPA